MPLFLKLGKCYYFLFPWKGVDYLQILAQNIVALATGELTLQMPLDLDDSWYG